MIRFHTMFAVILCTGAAFAFWPFSSGEAKPKPPRLHELLATANDLIEEAEDYTMEGNADEALSTYRKALEELARIAEENPERAETQEFAPLRHKIAAVSAAIDNIRFDQVNKNSRPVVLTDTSALEEKYAKKHNLASLRRQTNQEAKTPAAQAGVQVEEASKEPPPPTVGAAREALAAGNAEEAVRIADAVLAAKPGNLNAFVAKAAAQSAAGQADEAKKTLIHAYKANPKSPVPFYNLARVELAGGDKTAAKRFYLAALQLGGKKDPALEEALK
ncbi:MAG: tetratricopeptide repeat protein [Kiritimatiellae bacterium]|nr:tetratricopeptide repeat protein [Kiritimatiellia bacterium]